MILLTIADPFPTIVDPVSLPITEKLHKTLDKILEESKDD